MWYVNNHTVALCVQSFNKNKMGPPSPATRKLELCDLRHEAKNQPDLSLSQCLGYSFTSQIHGMKPRAQTLEKEIFPASTEREKEGIGPCIGECQQLVAQRLFSLLTPFLLTLDTIPLTPKMFSDSPASSPISISSWSH